MFNCPSLPEWYAAHETDISTNHWLLGRVVGMDSRWHGFFHLCAGVESGAIGAFTQVGVCEDSGKCRTRRFDFVRVIPGWLGALVYVGTDRRPFRTHTSAGGDDSGVCGVYRRGGVGPECVAIRVVSVAGGDWHRRRVGVGRHACRWRKRRRRLLLGQPFFPSERYWDV